MPDPPESATRARRPKAEDRIDACLPAETKQFIERAAGISGVTLSDFVISKAFEAARQIVLEHKSWMLNRQDSQAFVAALLNPPDSNDGLKAAAARYKARVRNAAA